MNMNEKKTPIFSIKKIKEFYFIVNEAVSEQNKSVIIQFQHYTRFFADDDIIDLTLRTYYTHDSTVPPKTILVDIHVQNIFEVENLKQYSLNDTEFVLPQNLIVLMVSIAISHARALVAKNIAGTIYQEHIIPIITNPVEIAKVFYPYMFLEQEKPEFDEAKNKTIKSRKKKTD